jgi:hypothetical protein
LANRVVQARAPFSVLFGDGEIVRADRMHVVERPRDRGSAG